MTKEEARNVLFGKGGYVSYWDKTIARWFQTPERERAVFNAEFLDDLRACGVVSTLMPEPYWGDPERCSIVLANHNPQGGGSDALGPDLREHQDAVRWFMERVRKNGYSSFAKLLPVGNPPPGFAAYRGRGWWKNRIERADCLATRFGCSSSEFRPFCIELCGWHSENWKRGNPSALMSGNPQFEKLVARPLIAAITLSKCKFGILVGAVYNDILRNAGFQIVQGPGVFPETNQRRFALWSNDTAKVVVSPGQHQSFPASRFYDLIVGLVRGTATLVSPASGTTTIPRPAPKKEKRLIQVLEGLKTAAREEFPACHRGAADNVLVLCEDAGAGWRLSVSVTTNGSDMKLEVHATDRASRESLKRRVSTLSDTTLPGAWKKCRIGGRGSLAVAAFKMNAFDKARPDFNSMIAAGKALLGFLRGVEARPRVG